MFNVEEPGPVIVGGVKLTLAFEGTPLTANVTMPLNPFVAVTLAEKLVLPPATTVCETGDTFNAKVLTIAVNERLLVQTPSVTETVINDAPVCPASGVTVRVRFVPLPPSERLALLFGTSTGLEDVTSTVRFEPATEPRLPKVKPMGPFEPPGGMTTSANAEICCALALNAISNELLVMK